VDALRRQFETNVFGWHDLTRRVITVMRSQGHGRIVNCSSILGLVPLRWRGAYNASKFALEGLTVTMRLELAGSGIHVSLIEPGPIESKIAVNALPHFLENIDMEASVHRKDYEIQLDRLQRGGAVNPSRLKPDTVYRVLRHALESPRPKPHYVVTRPARIGVLFKRLLPSGLFYAALKNQ
jgi:NAD(P)-dependent dehydrogenase (short-subunit alcohol dehydrogenase family)